MTPTDHLRGPGRAEAGGRYRTSGIDVRPPTRLRTGPGVAERAEPHPT